MKQIIIALLGVVITQGVAAQAGLYKSADDFVNGKLEHQQVEFAKHRLRTDIPFNKYVVKVVDGGESHTYYKWDVYGFKDKRNQVYRFDDEKTYRIVDTTAFLIYAREENIVRGKEKTRETRYYFSKSPESRILPLTIRNLKYSFPNREFHNLLDLQFRTNLELMRYDSYYGEYKLKSIYNKIMS